MDCVFTGAIANITPHGVKALRAIVNDSVLDVMFYLSSRFGPEVSNGLLIGTECIAFIH